MTRILYVHVVPPAMRLATLAITAGFLYAVADLCSSLVHAVRAHAPRKVTIMQRLVFATVLVLVLAASRSAAEPAMQHEATRDVEPFAPAAPREPDRPAPIVPTFERARDMGATAALFVADDVMPPARGRSLAALLAHFELPFGSRRQP